MGGQPAGLADASVLTFDCYGTLIDWERGILDSLHEVLGRGVADEDELLEAYGAEEASLETGAWRPYREIVREATTAVCRRYANEPTDDERRRFEVSVTRWPAFADSAPALAQLAQRFEMGVLTNCDEDLFAASSELLGNPFDWVVTAEQVRAYKPARPHFEAARERIGPRRDGWVHVAQSLYHDHAPAKAMGIRTVWINRRSDRAGSGATPLAEIRPDMQAADMATFARLALGEWLRR